MKPDFNNCLLNVIATIQKRYNQNSKYNTIKELEEMIDNCQHLFIMVLDGLGKNIIEKTLSNKSFIMSHLTKWITSVYPPTTVAATTALLSGLAPGETGWIGWHQYFDDLNRDVVLFKNTDAYTDEVITTNVTQTYLPYANFYDNFKGVETGQLYPAFKENGYKKFNQMINRMISISKQTNQTCYYCYWDQPDYNLHEFGTNSILIKRLIKKLDNEVARFYQKCGKNTALIVVADHGLVDTEDLYLTSYPDILSCLSKKPSLEVRTTAFKVNGLEHQKFKDTFNFHFGKWFDLIESDTFLKEGYLGPNYEKASKFLFDYVAIAKDRYNLAYEKPKMIFKANHAGGTEEEMIVPLMVVRK